MAPNVVKASHEDLELEPVRRTKVYAEVAGQIHRLIAEGRLKPGDRLPPERELAETFAVSRTSVRDAIAPWRLRRAVLPIGAGAEVWHDALTAAQEAASGDVGDRQRFTGCGHKS